MDWHLQGPKIFLERMLILLRNALIKLMVDVHRTTLNHPTEELSFIFFCSPNLHIFKDENWCSSLSSQKCQISAPDTCKLLKSMLGIHRLHPKAQGTTLSQIFFPNSNILSGGNYNLLDPLSAFTYQSYIKKVWYDNEVFWFHGTLYILNFFKQLGIYTHINTHISH